MQVFTSVLVLGVFFAVYVVTDVKSYKERKADSMLNLAQVIASNSISTIRFQDTAAARQVLSSLHAVEPDIIYVGITDKNGQSFAEYKSVQIKSPTLPTSLHTHGIVFSGHFLFVRNEIKSDSDVVGQLVMTVELSELEKIKQSKYSIGTILLVIALGFSFLIAMVIQASVSKRLLNLVRTMDQVGKTGVYDKTISDDGKDEISVLINVFNNLMEQIKENQQRKDEFIGIVSHELKTPLTSVKGYLELLYTMEDRQPNKQFTQKGLENVRKLETLIRDLLDVSKIQSGQLQLNLEEFRITDFMNETIASLQMISGTHDIIWENTVGNETVRADRHRIEQVLSNILSNAIKYSPNERKVMVYSTKTDSEMVIKVRDYGLGVPEAERLNIFERFYRSKDMSATILGFGLGLYICKDIITRHGGRIWVESEQTGSAFYFTVPLAHRSVSTETAASVTTSA